MSVTLLFGKKLVDLFRCQNLFLNQIQYYMFQNQLKRNESENTKTQGIIQNQHIAINKQGVIKCKKLYH